MPGQHPTARFGTAQHLHADGGSQQRPALGRAAGVAGNAGMHGGVAAGNPGRIQRSAGPAGAGRRDGGRRGAPSQDQDEDEAGAAAVLEEVLAELHAEEQAQRAAARAAAVRAALGRAGRAGGPDRGDPRGLSSLAEAALEEAGELGAVVVWYRGLQAQQMRARLGEDEVDPVLALPPEPAGAGPVLRTGASFNGSVIGQQRGMSPDAPPSLRLRGTDNGGGLQRQRMRELLEEAEPMLAPAGQSRDLEGQAVCGAELAGTLSPVRSPKVNAGKCKDNYLYIT